MTATERRGELEHAVRTAKDDLGRLRSQQRDATTKARKLREQLAARPGDEFDTEGRPKAKTEAKRLQAEMDTATSNLWGDRIKAAERRVTGAQRALQRHTSQHIQDLAAEREPEDLQSVADLDAALAEVERAARSVLNRASSWSQLMSSVQGLDPLRELPSYDQLNGLLRVVGQHKGQTRPPVPMSISPQLGETANKILTEHGWITPGALERRERRDEERAEQREREARRRERLHNVEFSFDKGTPPEAEMELLRRGWEAA